LRVLTKEEIQKLADRTREIRGKSHRPSQASSNEKNSPADLHDRARHGPDYTSGYQDLLEWQTDTVEKDSSRTTWTSLFIHTLLNTLKQPLLTSQSNPTDERYEEERDERRAARRRERNHDRHERDEYEDDSDDDFLKPRTPKMLEAPSTAGTSSSFTAGSSSTADQADFIRENRDRRSERERETAYMSGGLGRREER
jgi:hypothetical protein